ncbi:MAG: hypothetical protein WC812_04525 [Candidatus Pacearchaeota archaeon]|jgi:hypothetical protein
MKEDKLLEKLADLEHKQWSHWTRYLIKNYTKENINRWKKQIKTPYSKLSKREKESDREWAIKVLNLIKKQNNNEIKE